MVTLQPIPSAKAQGSLAQEANRKAQDSSPPALPGSRRAVPFLRAPLGKESGGVLFALRGTRMTCWLDFMTMPRWRRSLRQTQLGPPPLRKPRRRAGCGCGSWPGPPRRPRASNRNVHRLKRQPARCKTPLHPICFAPGQPCYSCKRPRTLHPGAFSCASRGLAYRPPLVQLIAQVPTMCPSLPAPSTCRGLLP